MKVTTVKHRPSDMIPIRGEGRGGGGGRAGRDGRRGRDGRGGRDGRDGRGGERDRGQGGGRNTGQEKGRGAGRVHHATHIIDLDAPIGAKLAWLSKRFYEWEDASEIVHQFSPFGLHNASYLVLIESCGNEGGPKILEALLTPFTSESVFADVEQEKVNMVLLQILKPSVNPALFSLLMRTPDTILLMKLARLFDKLLDLSQEALHILPFANLFQKVDRLLVNTTSAHKDLIEYILKVKFKYEHKIERLLASEIAAEERERQKSQQRADTRKGKLVLTSDAELDQLELDKPFRKMSVVPLRDDVVTVRVDPVEDRDGQDERRNRDDHDEFLVPNIGNVVTSTLPMNRPIGAFDNLNAYIGTHFRLLREDAIVALRESMTAYRGNERKKKVIIRKYDSVRLVSPVIGKLGLEYRIRFHTQHQNVRWEEAKLLMTGSLLCLIPVNDKQWTSVVFATVSNRDTKNLLSKHGPMIDIVIHEPYFDENDSEEMHAQNLAAVTSLKLDTTKKWIMFESPAYFEAFSHVLRALQDISDDITALPFGNFLLRPSAEMSPPSYLPAIIDNIMMRNPGELKAGGGELTLKPGEMQFDKVFTNFVKETGSNVLNVCNTVWPEFTHNLNNSQYTAIKHALTSKIALIQGPPGCGKTHVGVLLSKILLRNMKVICPASPRPLLFVCYTNHALDQLLEQVHEFEPSIVRIGGSTKSDVMQLKTLHHWKIAQQQGNGRGNLRQGVSRRYAVAKGQQRHAYSEITEDLEIQRRLAQGLVYADDLPHLVENVPWADIHRRSLEAKLYLIDKKKQNKDGEWNIVGNAVEFDDIVSRWLHIPKKKAKQKQKDDGTIPNPDTREQANEDAADELAAEERDKQAFRGEIDRNFQAAGDHAANIAAEALAAEEDFPDLANLNLGGEDEEGFYSDEDLEGGGPARVATRRGQRDHTKVMLKECTDVWALSMEHRKLLKEMWINDYMVALSMNIEYNSVLYEKAAKDLNQLNEESEAIIMRNAKVIGMTTTGAAKFRSLLKRVQPAVLVVEEAAEVLEAHILSSLVPSIQHLILIGDHQQLRPKVDTYDLAKRHHMDISMFERLIANGAPHVTLTTQHRMRPEISQLIRHSIYSKLDDHDSVKVYPHVQGMGNDVFFLTHDSVEVGGQAGMTMSFTNPYEAEMIVKLAMYLLRNGYTAQDIVILAMYTGQQSRIRNIICNHIEKLSQLVSNGGGGVAVLGNHKEIRELKAAVKATGQPATLPQREGLGGVRVSTVDNFQGEEAKIVLLSLVRSNAVGNVGFLKEANRVCVALSRAKHGMYILGNATMFEPFKLWRQVLASIANGPSFRMQCQKHPATFTDVKTPDDFINVADGGCCKPCDQRLNCGHACQQRCHSDSHDGVRCIQPCNRPRKCGHICPLPCYKECGDCLTQVERVMPICGHSCQMKCFQSVENFQCYIPCSKKVFTDCDHKCPRKCGSECAKNCETLIKVSLRSCFCPEGQHTAKIHCHQKNENLPCKSFCKHPLSCGHLCQGKCHECYPTDTEPKASQQIDQTDDEQKHTPCMERCTRVLFCGHTCSTKHPCSGACPPCTENCQVRCVHSSCNRQCGDVCVPCSEKCRNACEHSACSKLCGEPCDREGCDKTCRKTLKCGHPCIGLCGEECPTQCRVCEPDYFDPISRISLAEAEPETRFVQLSDCGHTFDVEMLDGYLKSTYAPTAADTIEGADETHSDKAVTLPCCPQCRKHILVSPSRYSNIVKASQAKADAIKKKMSGPWLRTELNNALKDMGSHPDKREGQLVHQLIGLAEKMRSGSYVQVTIQTLIGQVLRLLGPEAAANAATKLNARLKKEYRIMESDKHLQQALAMLGYEVEPPFDPTNRGPSVHLSVAERATEMYHVIVQLAFGMASREGMAEAAKIRIEAAIRFARMPGVQIPTAQLDILNAAKADVASAEKKYAEATKKEMGLKGSWHTCPNGHNYLIGDCGGARVESRCPDCKSTVGGTGYKLAAGNASVSMTPWAAQVAMQDQRPAQAVLDRIAAEEAAGGGGH